MYDKNPGEILRDYLMKMYPMSQSGFLFQIDRDFKDSEPILDAFYWSFINYLLRRFVVVATYHYRMYPPENYGEQYYKEELTRYFTKNTRYQKSQVKLLVNLLWDCMYFANKELSNSDKSRIRTRDQREGNRCYICGIDLEYNNQASNLYPSIDHKWPRMFGGMDRDDNLTSMCPRCNNALKKDYIDWSDYHFEEIALPSLDMRDFRRQARRNRPQELSLFEAAILAKNDYACSMCGDKAYKIGELLIDRISENDAWHFLNLQTYCSGCYGRLVHRRDKGGSI
ncbi:MAG: HNH endonuclease [Candidatus Uhrbacteria bacterium]